MRLDSGDAWALLVKYPYLFYTHQSLSAIAYTKQSKEILVVLSEALYLHDLVEKQ